MVVSLGSILGSLLTIALLVLGALLFAPNHIFPKQLSSALLAGAWPYGQKMFVLVCLGTLACIGGAATETGLSGAYNTCQFFRLAVGKEPAVPNQQRLSRLPG